MFPWQYLSALNYIQIAILIVELYLVQQYLFWVLITSFFADRSPADLLYIALSRFVGDAMAATVPALHWA